MAAPDGIPGSSVEANAAMAAPLTDPASVLVRFTAGVDDMGRRQVADRHGTGVAEAVAGTAFFVLSVEPGTAGAALSRLLDDPRVAVAEANYIQRPAATPTDPRYAPSQASYFEVMRLPAAWDLMPGGDDRVLAVVDSGVDPTHPDLAGRLVPGRDIRGDDDDPSDAFGHGTEVATVAAAAVDGTGMAGVAPRGKILPVRVAGADGNSTDAEIAEGITWAADHGADVINISMGGPVSTGVLKAAVEYAQRLDVLIVAAVGNQGSAFVTYPAAYEGVVGVGATGSDGHRAGFSNYGPSVDVAAPGVDILAGSIDHRYHLRDGTSFSAPMVAAIALGLRGAFPGEPAAAIAERLRTGARDTGPLGFDDYYGAGVVDALGALGYRQGRSDGLGDAPPDSTPAHARALGVHRGAVTTGSLSYESDVDWFTFDVTTPTWFRFSLTRPGGAVAGVSVELFDAELRSLGLPNDTRLPPGHYFLRIRAKKAVDIPDDYEVHVAHGRAPGELYLYDPQEFSDSLLGSPAVAVAAGDLTGDGRADLLVSTGAGGGTDTSHGLFVLPNAGPKSFAQPVRVESDAALSGGGMSVALADLDGDGDLDAAVATAAGVEIHDQGPAGLGGPARLVPVAGAAQVEAGDIDGDGDVDLVTGGPGGVHLLRRVATGGYDVTDLDTGSAAEVEVADMDADGRADIVALVCPAACDTVMMLRSSGTGLTRSASAIVSSAGPHSCVLAVGDTDGDGYGEAFVACESLPVKILPGTADGLMAARPIIAELPTIEALETADFDGDGLDELVAGTGSARKIFTLWPTLEDGSWSAAVNEDTLETQQVGALGPKGLALADLNGDAAPDLAAAAGAAGPTWLLQSAGFASPKTQSWVRDTAPADGSSGASPDVQPTLLLTRAVSDEPTSPPVATLTDGLTGRAVAVTASYDVAANSLVLRPEAPLRTGRPYSVSVKNGRDAANNLMPADECCFRFVVGQLPGSAPPPRPPTPPAIDPPGGSPTDIPLGSAQTPASRSGYWMLDRDGSVYAFGDASLLGHSIGGAVDLEPTPTGKGYWALNRSGIVSDFGDATRLGNLDLSKLAKDEQPASLSATPSGRGYWVFTNRGRAMAFGDAAELGDMSGTKLNKPVLGSVATPSGRGYYMVASDGGIFAFGDAAFSGSMGASKLNAPVQSLVPDADGKGYWLVASDGGIFAFDAPFRGSMGATKLNKPVVGMVRYGDGYLMVGADGGIFNFSSLPFAGSLGDKPPASPVVAVAALP
jgi:hypothetical protein